MAIMSNFKLSVMENLFLCFLLAVSLYVAYKTIILNDEGKGSSKK